MSPSEALDGNNYVHFRNVQAALNKARLDEASAPFSKNFLESIKGDKPSGCWSFQLDL